RKTGKLAVYDGGGKVCMQFTFTDMFPKDITSGGGTLAVDGGGALAEDTIVLGYTQVMRTT
ncbi:MAG: phage tail protein, partial [Cyanobacteria bacterium P01_H01_bin.121]